MIKITQQIKKGGRKNKKQKGGAEDLTFKMPMVSNVSAAGAIKGSMHKQQAGNKEMTELNKSMAGGAVVVPQMNQAGASGNASIAGGIGATLQGRADGKYDKDVYNKPEPSGMPSRGGRRRRKKKTRKRKRKRKTKHRRKRKTKRKTKRKSKKRRK